MTKNLVCWTGTLKDLKKGTGKHVYKEEIEPLQQRYDLIDKIYELHMKINRGNKYMCFYYHYPHVNGIYIQVTRKPDYHQVEYYESTVYYDCKENEFSHELMTTRLEILRSKLEGYCE